MNGKHVSICLIFLLVLSIAGCAGREEAQKDSVLDEEVVSDNGNYIVVGYSQVGSESDYRIANTESIKTTFSEENGYYLLFDDAQNNQEKQLKAVRNFILQEVDYIILDPVVETGWDAVLQEAKAAGIPVILADRSVEVEEEGLYTCWVGSDFTEEGRRAGEWLKNYLESAGRAEETIYIVTLQGTLGSSAQIGRTKGFETVLEKQPGWVMLEKRDADFTQAKGEEVMGEFLNTYSDIDVVVSENDNMTFGAIDAIQKAGKTCGPEGEITIISFDAVRAALEAMQQGKINADFECNPILGPKVAEVIVRLEEGEKVEKIQYIEETYYDTTMDLENILKEREY